MEQHNAVGFSEKSHNSPVQTVPAADIGEPATAGVHGAIGLGHIYGYPGNYTVTVKVADTYSASDTESFQVNVVDVAPTVTAGPNLSQSPGVPVTLNSSFSSPGFPADGNAETYSYTIAWGDGHTDQGTAQITQAGGPGVPTLGTVSGTHTYAKHGDYTVTVTVTDSLGQQGTGTLTVLDTPPMVTVGADQTVNQGSPVTIAPNTPFAATFSDAGFEAGATAANYAATIDWGDGMTTPGTVQITQAGGPGVPTLGTVSGSHYYADEGIYYYFVN